MKKTLISKNSKSPATKKTSFIENTPASAVKDVTRKIKSPVQLLLYVRAGGRCEFDGCNEYLVEHHLTHTQGNFGQMAHVVAFSRKGPRGNITDRPEDINSVDNLMLLCHRCHKLIDDNPDEHTREELEAFKKAHEERIFRLTATAPDRQTTVVTIKAKIGNKITKISQGEINEAVAPRYAASRSGVVIDLSNFDDGGPLFYELAAQKIIAEIKRAVEMTMHEENTNHISFFGIGAMPLLILAGSELGDKVPCELYQKHRDTEDWTWKDDGEPVAYKFHRIREGTDRKLVALVLSLSGKVDIETLPKEMANATIYELSLDGMDPHPGFLRQRSDLKNFRDAYQRTLRAINADHGKLDELHLFPATPAPVAIACGRELMPKVDPTVVIYDDDKRYGGYQRILEVNK